jgi:hypothetical protein
MRKAASNGVIVDNQDSAKTFEEAQAMTVAK